MPSPSMVLLALWILWASSWFLASLWASPSTSRAHGLWLYRLLQVAGGGALCLAPLHAPPVAFPYDRVRWAMVALAACGFGFCWWARIHLGRLWSAAVVRKQDHVVVRSGPYGIVRHPIYTGVIVAAFATAVVKADWIAFLGVAVITAGVYIKARAEERFLRDELGPSYHDYIATVPMLAPFGVRSIRR